jgi:hypothetical protein
MVMRGPRFSIAHLLGAVLFVAIAFAALRASSAIWDSAALTASATILLVAVLLAIHRAERSRAFWIGFAFLGGAYLVASLVPEIESRLLTAQWLSYPSPRRPWSRDEAIRLSSPLSPSMPPNPQPPGSEYFIRIGHSLIALVVGFLGGHLSRWMYVGNRGGTVTATRE